MWYCRTEIEWNELSFSFSAWIADDDLRGIDVGKRADRGPIGPIAQLPITPSFVAEV